MRLWRWIGGLTGFAALAGIAIGVVVGAPVADGVDRGAGRDGGSGALPLLRLDAPGRRCPRHVRISRRPGGPANPFLILMP